MGIKTDMAKTYNRVEWINLKATMESYNLIALSILLLILFSMLFYLS